MRTLEDWAFPRAERPESGLSPRARDLADRAEAIGGRLRRHRGPTGKASSRWVLILPTRGRGMSKGTHPNLATVEQLIAKREK